MTPEQQAAQQKWLDTPYQERELTLHMATDLALEISEKAPGWEVIKIENNGRGWDDHLIYRILAYYEQHTVVDLYSIRDWEQQDKMPAKSPEHIVQWGKPTVIYGDGTEPVIMMSAPNNADCPSDDPCTGGKDVDACKWTCEDEEGNYYPCECQCHVT